MTAKAPLPPVQVGDEFRPVNPRDRRPDDSVMLQCVGGPYDRKVVRVYPPYDDPIPLPEGSYYLSGPVRKNGKDVLTYHKETQ